MRAAFSPEILVAPPDPLPEIRLGDLSVRVEVSYRDNERMRGLMHRSSMSLGEGMLFIYRVPARKSFWMLNCHFALDVAHFSPERKLLNVVSIDPYPDPAFDTGDRAAGEGEAQFVLEVPKGWFHKRGLVDLEGRPIRELTLELPDTIASLVYQAD
jgi:uncharacterized membrane protein (UPF0127 family)